MMDWLTEGEGLGLGLSLMDSLVEGEGLGLGLLLGPGD
jgi:hypothetical protein